ncbi:MAG: DNRLRE domain-containing protein [Nocardioidaceae bacterium]
MSSQTTAESKTWANPDGTFTLVASTGPVRVQAPDGSWAPIDTDLTAQDGRLVPTVASADVSFSDGGDASLATISPSSGSGLQMAFGWDGTLPAPAVNGAEATYPDAVPGGDLVVRALPSGFAEDVVLRQAPQQPFEVRIPVSLDGLNLQTTPSDELTLRTAAGRLIAQADTPTMWDSAVGPATGQPAHSSPIGVSVEAGSGGSDAVIVLRPSAAFLHDPSTTYPVTIDPTTTLTANPDTWVSDNHPTSAYGSASLEVGTNDSGANLARSYLRFPMGSLTGTDVLSADLKLYERKSYSCTQSEVEVKRVTEAWTATGTGAITNSTQPTSTSSGMATVTGAHGFSSACPAAWVTFPIDTIAAAWAGGAVNDGVVVRATNESVSRSYKSFDSNNYAGDTTQPSLTVTYNHVPGAPTDVRLSPCAEGVCDPLVTNSLTPTLHARATDPDNQDLRYDFQVRPGGSTTVLTTGSTPFVPSGNGDSWTVPAGNLADGSSYQYRAGADDGTDTTWSDWIDFTVNMGTPTPTTVPSGPLTQDTTWGPTGSPYVVGGYVTVVPNTTLTILPGTVVKMVAGARIFVRGGQVDAKGTTAAPIIVTSWRDDTVGGDSNGDGNATQPAPGDYGTAFNFAAPDSDPDLKIAADTPTSVLDNVSFRYGGSDPSGNCLQGDSPLIDIGGDGRVQISHSEFVHILTTAVAIGQNVNGIGNAVVSDSHFIDGGCGISAKGGEILDNVFEPAISQPFGKIFGGGEGVKVYGNYFYSQPFMEDYSGTTREQYDFRNNAFLAGWAFLGGYPGFPNDLSDNWWGRPPPYPKPKCVDPNSQSIPEWDLVFPDTGDCQYQAYVRGFFTTVDPGLAQPPPFPQAGPGSNPAVPHPVPQAQLYGGGGGGSGSQFAANPSGDQSDPVDSADGSYTATVTDADVPALGIDLLAQRTYNSADTSSGWLGQGWKFTDEIHLNFPDPSTVTLVSGDGQQVQYTQQADGTYLGGPGATAALASAGVGYTVTTRNLLTYTFNGAGAVTSLTDRNRNTQTFNYDAAGQLSRISDGSRYLDFTFTGTHLSKVTLSDGRWVGYTYTGNLLTAVRDLAGHTTSYGYDANGQLTSQVDPLQHTVVRLAYDPVTGRVSDQWDALNDHTTFGWDAANQVATMTDPRGGQWVDSYSGNVLTKRVDPIGRTWRYEYDANLQLMASTDPRGFRSIYTHDANGNLVCFEGPNGTTVTSYDANHNAISSVNARGTQVDYSYDTNGNLTRVSRPNPNGTGTWDTVNTFFSTGLLKSTKDARGNLTGYTYTPDGDLKTVTTPNQEFTSYAYDTTGRLTDTVDPRGNVTGANPADYTTHYDYNDDNQLTQTTSPLGHTTSSDYDAAGRLIDTVDAKQRMTVFGHDDAGHLTSVQGPDLAIPAATTSYDANGNVASLTDHAGRKISYTYDAADQPITATGPLGSYQMGYDHGGDLTSITNPANQTTTMNYTSAGQLRVIDYPDTTHDITYSYDPVGNRASMTDGSGQVSYTYNALDMLTAVTRGSQTFSYTYDPAGNITSLTNPTGKSFTYTYTGDEQVKTVASGSATLDSYAYNPDGALHTATLGDGSLRTFSYDHDGNLTGLSDVKGATTFLNDNYTLDATGNPTAITHADGTTDTYSYDTLDRLTGVCYHTSSCDGAANYVNWTYDAVGNRTSETRPTGTTTYGYDPQTGELTSTTGPSGTTTYGYDALGQQTSAGPNTYAYNAAGRMTSATVAGTQTAYTYDGDGRRLTATQGSTVDNLWWDPRSDNLAAETDQNNTRIRDYAYGLGLTAYLGPDGTPNYIHTDAQGSVRAVTLASRTNWTYDYEPYGVVRTATKINPNADDNPIGWAGQYADPSGDMHLRARQYNPTTGQFSTPDPAGATSASATYTYAGSNPMVAGDPTGLFPDWGAVASAVSDVAPTVAAIAGTAAVVFPPIAPIAAPVAILAGAAGAAGAAYIAYQTCTSGKGSCGAAILNAAINTTLALPATALGADAFRLERGLASAAEAATTEGADIGATTAHGAERVAGAGATRGGVLSSDQIIEVRGSGAVWSQADGATVRVLQNEAGRFNVVVDGDRGLITTFSNLSQKSFDRLANNYGWTP